MVGFFWGIFTGEYSTSLSIAIFFELFWLDMIPAGTFIPPQLTAATFAALSLTTFFGLENPAKIMGIVFASMPLAWLGTKLEGWLRDRERAGYNTLLNWARNPESSHVPSRLILQSLGRTLIMGWVTFFISILLLKQFFQFIFSMYPELFTSINVTWVHLWMAATLGGVMALRLKRAYVILATGISLFILFAIWPRF
ncbi:hypothetical protein MRX56_05040 [Pseudodesulfovibrio sp. S3-i]|nr:hypothetical protein [Pseudodesulfovibrio sp. S3-i]